MFACPEFRGIYIQWLKLFKYERSSKKTFIWRNGSQDPLHAQRFASSTLASRGKNLKSKHPNSINFSSSGSCKIKMCIYCSPTPYCHEYISLSFMGFPNVYQFHVWSTALKHLAVLLKFWLPLSHAGVHCLVDNIKFMYSHHFCIRSPLNAASLAENRISQFQDHPSPRQLSSSWGWAFCSWSTCSLFAVVFYSSDPYVTFCY